MARDLQQVRRATPPLSGQQAPRGRSYRRSANSLKLRAVLIGLGLACTLIVIEGLAWMINPLNLFGAATGIARSLPALFSLIAHTPLVIAVLLLECVVAIALALLLTRPLALRRYCKNVFQAGERYRSVHTSLPNWPSLYETTVSYYQYTPDPAVPVVTRERSLLDLTRGGPFSGESRSHLVLFGEAGSGKTTALYCYQFYALQGRRRIFFGREKIPVYVPLSQYALYLRSIAPDPDSYEDSSLAVRGAAHLLDFLYLSDLPGMHHLRPYLTQLAAQNRLLLLCDGLHDVEESDQPLVIAELADLMSQDRNRLILTCRAVDAHRQPALAEAIEANLVSRAYLQPLTTTQMRAMVEQYIEGESAGKKWKHTAGQVMDIITRTRLQTCCETPLLLLALLGVIDGMGIERGRRLDTRGRLLRAYVGQRIAQTQRSWGGRAPTEREVLLFLGELACAARWSNLASVVQLHDRPHLFGDWLPSLEHHAGALLSWLEASEGEMFLSAGLHEPYTRQEAARLLQFALESALISISAHGYINFRHELIASYLIAEYFAALQAAGDTALQKTRFAGLLSQALKRQDTSDAFSRWSMPGALWAGLIDEPATFAGRFVEYAQEHADATLESLSLSLLCLGVAAYPPRLAATSPTPPNLARLFAQAVQDEAQRSALAHIVARHAEEGAYEIYQALFALLMEANIEQFAALLDRETVAALLMRRLVEIVDDVEYEEHVKRLVRIIGNLGAAAVPLAAPLSKAGAGQSARLRTAAINILGGTGDQGAVAPLDACLYDSDTFIVNRAVSSLYRLGPTNTLAALIGELENVSQTTATLQVHLMALRIIARFLEDHEPGRQLKAPQRQQIMAVLMNILNRAYALDVQELARQMLVRQGQAAEYGAGGELAVAALIQNLSASEEQVARTAMSALADIGPAASPLLVQHLRKQPSELATSRIIETLGLIRDARALPTLLRLLSEQSPALQQQVAQALLRYGDDSIPGLIYQLLQGESDLVATSAEQILSDLGASVVDPVTEALIPIYPGRTHLLVRVLGRLHQPESTMPLVALLEATVQEASPDPQLILALIDALGQFQDECVVAPLMDVLASTNALYYEGAINALSSIGALACPVLVAALDVPQETAVTQRIERALLGMSPFPGECLVDAFAGGTDAQVEHVMHVFMAGGAEAAQVVVSNLNHPDRQVRQYIGAAAELMPGAVIVPALIDALDHPDRDTRAVVAEYLLKHPDEAIPQLVDLLQEDTPGDLAQRLLLEFGSDILPSLIPALDSLSDLAHDRACQLVVELARQSPEDLRQVLLLFTLPLPQRAYEALIAVLAGSLADISVPSLLDGLQDAHLIAVASEVLERMVNKQDARSPFILEELLAALRLDSHRQGAEITLVKIGSLAVPGVGNLITDPEPLVAHTAQNILCQIGVPAFAFIWAAHSDVTNRPRREAARAIFRRMPTVVIKDELVQLLSSDEPEDISMALALLLERIHDESLQTEHGHEMIPILLEYVQTHANDLAGHRVLALLLLIGGRAIVEYIAQVLYEYPNHQQQLLYSLLLLGEEAEELLLEILHDAGASMPLRAEAAGLLGLLAPHVDIREYARMISDYGLWAGQSQGQHGILQPDQLDMSLRALGGLLAGGHWHVEELDRLRAHTQKDSPEHELYAVLLGWRYHPYISTLEQELADEREEHKRRLAVLGQEILSLRTARSDLEVELAGLQHAHEERGKDLDEASQTIADWQTRHARVSKEKDQIHQTLQSLRNENQSLQDELQQVRLEKQQIATRLARMEQDLRAIGGFDEQEKKRR